MRLIKVALMLVGFTLGAQTFAQELDVNEDVPVYLFNEGDQPMDAEEVALFPTEDGPDSARTRIHCASHGYRMNRCPVNGRIQSVRLTQRTSFAPCIAGRTFGATRRFIWVTRGCAGNFIVRFERRGGGGWD